MGVLEQIAVPEELREAVSPAAWLRGLLEAERALANAEALAGVIPIEAGARIAALSTMSWLVAAQWT